jgi:transcriptional regulator with XRE-family HTH domain
MSKRSQAIDSLHPKIRQRLTQLGLNIQEARKRRRLAENDLARLANVSRSTIRRISQGDPSVSMGVLSSVLGALHLDHGLDHLANPNNDREGQLLDRERLPKRIRKKTEDDEYDF